jgi:ribonuclease HI
MELTGVLEGLRFLKESCQVTIHTDSTYVLKAFEENWIVGWQKRGWKTASGKPVANRELWEELITQVGRHQVRWVWIKGHNGTRFNERADYLAVCESQARR